MNDYIQSIQRAIAIMRAFSEQEPELGVSEIGRRVGLHKSTVARILRTLQHEGLVSQNPDNDKYRLGMGLISLAGVALGRINLRGAAQPHLGELLDQTRETINISILDGEECVNVERISSPQPLRYVGWIGRRTPLHCTAAGKVLLAWQDEAHLRASLPERLRPFTRDTILTRKRLLTTLKQVRAVGYAEVHGEFEEGFSAVAAPLRNHQGRVVGALTVSGPTFRLEQETEQRFVLPVVRTARIISMEMGYIPGEQEVVDGNGRYPA